MSKKNQTACPVRKTSIGGQALMEGIMMRGPVTTAMAVRNPQGEIVIEKFPTQTKKRPAICRVPIIRGVFGFIDSMVFGYKCLMRSAEISGLEELEAEMEKEKAEKKAAKQAEKKAAKQAAKEARKGITVPETAASDEEVPVSAAESVTASASDTADTATAPATDTPTAAPAASNGGKKESSALMTGIMIVSVVLAMAIAIGLFVVMPAWLYDDVLAKHISWIDADNRFAQSVFEGVLRVLLLVGYMSLMLLMKDIRRTFRFHGAEHKTIFCYEHGLELTVENIRGERRFHPRCGTSFLILMMLVSIIVGFFIPGSLPTVLRVCCKLLLFPVIMGLGYELIKICGRYDNWLTHLISLPGVWLQHITVLEPDDSMIECAIAAMKEVIPEDGSDKW